MTPKKTKQVQAMVRSANKPRRVDCEVCGKKVIVKGSRALELCRAHRNAHIEARNERYKKGQANTRRAVRNLRTNDGNSKKGTTAPVRKAQKDAPNAAQVPTNGVVAPKKGSTTHRRGTFEQAVSVITAPAQRGGGFRHGWLGMTGSGKTTAMRSLVLSSKTLVLIHDDSKPDVQYKHPVVKNFDDAPDDATRIVFRGDAFKSQFVEVEEVAQKSVEITQATREPVWLLVDEVDRACSPGMRAIVSPTFKFAFTKGRQFGLSVIWSTVNPKVPEELIDQASTVAFCRMGPRALNYTDDTLKMDKDMLHVIPTLADFEFVIYENGRPWNRVIYTCPKPGEIRNETVQAGPRDPDNSSESAGEQQEVRSKETETVDRNESSGAGRLQLAPRTGQGGESRN